MTKDDHPVAGAVRRCAREGCTNPVLDPGRKFCSRYCGGKSTGRGNAKPGGPMTSAEFLRAHGLTIFNVKLEAGEKAALADAARRDGLALSPWCRSVLVRAAEGVAKRVKPGGGTAVGTLASLPPPSVPVVLSLRLPLEELHRITLAAAAQRPPGPRARHWARAVLVAAVGEKKSHVDH